MTTLRGFSCAKGSGELSNIAQGFTHQVNSISEGIITPAEMTAIKARNSPDTTYER
jgi:hypothetical protein